MQRITNSIQVSDLIRSLNERMRTLNDLQNQVASGKRVYYASDDPAAAGLILQLRNSLRQNEQFQENIDNAISWLTATESSLQQLNELLIQAREDAVEGSNEAISPEGMAALADEIDGYLENIFSMANSDYSGKSLFGGTNTTEPAFTAVRDPVTGQITGVAPNPDGTTGSMMRQVGTRETIQINIPGTDLFQPGGPAGAEDIFQVLIDLRNALQSGDPELVGEALPLIDQAMENVSDFNALVGSRVTRLTNLQDALLVDETNLTSQLSEQEDADLVEVMTQMTLEQNAYQVALNVGSMIIQPSLVNFI